MNKEVDTLTAKLSGYDNADEYKEIMEKRLSALDKFIISKVSNEEEYAFARQCQSALTSLECYTFNQKIEGYTDQIYAQKDVVYKAIKRYNRRFLIKDSLARSVARYLLWSYTFTREDFAKLLEFAVKNNLLRKRTTDKGECTFYVVGLNYKVGDNVFTVDAKGREHRRYLESSANQAFPLSLNEDRKPYMNDSLISKIPEMEERYSVTYVGDGKGCARSIGLTYKERDRICEHFVN